LIKGCGGDQSQVDLVVEILAMDDGGVLKGKGKDVRDGITPQKQINGLSGEILRLFHLSFDGITLTWFSFLLDVIVKMIVRKRGCEKGLDLMID